MMGYKRSVTGMLAVLLVFFSQVNAAEIKLETLMRTLLEGVEGTEIIVSKVEVPAQTRFPKHWHPGEEFVYVLDGNISLWQEGKALIQGKQGEVLKVPFKQVHTGITADEPATIIVFRVHEKGQPERVLIKDK